VSWWPKVLVSSLEPHVVVLTQNADVNSDQRPRVIAATLAEEGYNVSLVGPVAHSEQQQAPIRGLDIYTFEMPRRAAGMRGQAREQLQSLCRSAKVLRRLARARPIDVLHAGNPPDTAWLLPWLLKGVQGFRPAFVYDQHDPAPLVARDKFEGRAGAGMVEVALRFLERRSFKRAVLAVFASDGFQDRARHIGLVRSPSIVARNGWMLPSTDGRTFDWRRGDRPLIAYVGTINSQDCVSDLVEAIMALERDVQVVVVGDGDALADVRTAADASAVSDSFVWLGWLEDRSEVAAVVRAADVCVAPEIPSGANDLTTFVKVIEYLSAGAAVVAHRLRQTEALAGDAVEYASDATPQGLAAAIGDLLGDAARAEELRARARFLFDDHLDWRSSGGPALKAAYAALLRPTGPAPAERAEAVSAT
jgi:glycosyltransferase involved in cell wall biosynthesis